MNRSHRAASAAAGVSFVLLAACASNEPAPSPQLSAVRQSIEQAQQADAQHYATRELNMARNKLDLAEQAHEDGKEARAADLAEQAKLDSEYAMAIAQNQDAQSALNALNDTLDTLRSEVQSQGSVPSTGTASPQQQGVQAPAIEAPGSGTSTPAQAPSTERERSTQ